MPGVTASLYYEFGPQLIASELEGYLRETPTFEIRESNICLTDFQISSRV
jgi:hypothetical protein